MDAPRGDDTAEQKMQEVNMANDVLSSATRRKGYDNMLATRRAMDAPRESPILVFLALFLLASFIVRQYQLNEYTQLKTKILEQPKIKRELEKVMKTEDEPVLSKTEKNKKVDLSAYDDELLTKLIQETETSVIGWTGRKPTLTDAAILVLKSPLTITTSIFQGLKGLVMGSD